MGVKMKKKNYMKYFLLVLVIFLVGCGGKEEKAGSETELTVGTWSSTPEESKMLKKQFAAFEKANPNITINHRIYVNNYAQSIQTDYAAGIAPDVFYVDIADSANYINKKVIAPLDRYLTEDVNLIHNKVALDGFKGKDGKIYGLPKDCATLVLFYNKEYLKAAGVDNPPKTWAELEAVSKKLLEAKKDGKLSKKFIHPMSIVFDGVRVAPFIYSNGGKMIDENQHLDLSSKETKEAMEFYYSLAKNGYADIPQNQGTASIVSSFSEGKSAMIMSGTWAEAFLKKASPDLDYDKALIPYSKKPSTMFLSVAFAVNSQTEKKPEAARFIQFITGVEGQKILVENEHALPTINSLMDVFVERYPDKKAFIESINYATPWNWGLETSKISTEMKIYGEMVVTDKKVTVDEIVEKLTEKF